jgi:hypothetical protein
VRSLIPSLPTALLLYQVILHIDCFLGVQKKRFKLLEGCTAFATYQSSSPVSHTCLAVFFFFFLFPKLWVKMFDITLLGE